MKHFSDSEIWERFVGSQTPIEFMELSDTKQASKAVVAYLCNCEFANGISVREYEQVYKQMCRYIHAAQTEVLAS